MSSNLPHYNLTLLAIDAAVRQQLKDSGGVNDDGRWHPEDVAAAVVICTDAVTTALTALMHSKQISFD